MCGAVCPRKAAALAVLRWALLSVDGLPQRGAFCQFGWAFRPSAAQRLMVALLQPYFLLRVLYPVPEFRSAASCLRWLTVSLAMSAGGSLGEGQSTAWVCHALSVTWNSLQALILCLCSLLYVSVTIR